MTYLSTKKLTEKVLEIANSDNQELDCQLSINFENFNTKNEVIVSVYNVTYANVNFTIETKAYPKKRKKTEYSIISDTDLLKIDADIIKLYNSIFNPPKFKVGDTIVMKDNDDYEIVIEIIDEDEDGFIYYEGSDEYAGSIREEDAVLADSDNKNSIYNTFKNLINS